jgi:quinol monooxygenase YgiN
MAMTALCSKGNYVHVYDFRVKPGTGDEFIRLFDKFDYSDANPMHKSPAQVKDGVLCRDTADPNHFWLLGEWRDIVVHADIRKQLMQLAPEFVKLIEGGKFVPLYGEVVCSTPQHLLDAASQAA